MICAQDFISYIVLGMHSMWMIHLNVLIWGFIILETCCLAFQVDIPTLIIENVGKEGLKHLEMYLSAKEKGIYIYISVWLSKIVYLILDNYYRLGVSWHCVWWWEKMYLQNYWLFTVCSESDVFIIVFPVKVSQVTNTQTAILDRFGPRMHCAMQNRQMELHYLRKLSESIIPFILPPDSLQCR